MDSRVVIVTSLLLVGFVGASVSTQSVYGWLAGSRPYRDRITRLCLHFGIREKWLWDGEGREENDHTSARVADSVAHYLPAQLSDDALASRLSDCILTVSDCPPAFLAIALADIDALYAELCFRAATKTSSPQRNNVTSLSNEAFLLA